MYTYASKYNSWKQGAVHGKLKATLTIEWNEITNKWNKQKNKWLFLYEFSNTKSSLVIQEINDTDIHICAKTIIYRYRYIRDVLTYSRLTK